MYHAAAQTVVALHISFLVLIFFISSYVFATGKAACNESLVSSISYCNNNNNNMLPAKLILARVLTLANHQFPCFYFFTFILHSGVVFSQVICLVIRSEYVQYQMFSCQDLNDLVFLLSMGCTV